MTRTLVGIIAGLAVGLTSTAGGRCQSALGRVVNPDGTAAAGALVRFFPQPEDWPPWLADSIAALAPDDLVVGERLAASDELAATRSDASGRFRVPVARPGFGALWVDAPALGLAALLPQVASDVGVAVTLARVGQLRLDDGQPFVAHLRAWTAPGDSTALGALQGSTINLPSGRYSVLIEVAGRYAEHACTIEASKTTHLPAPPPIGELPRLIVDANRNRLDLPLWPGVELRTHHDGSVLLPATNGYGRLRERVIAGDGDRVATAYFEHGYDGRSPRPQSLGATSRSNWSEVTIRCAAGADGKTATPWSGAEVYSIEHHGGAASRRSVRSHSRTDADGRALIAVAPSPGECFLVIRVDGRAPVVMKQPIPEVIELTLPKVTALEVRVETEDPVHDGPATVRIDQRPWGLATWRSITDARGIASFDELAPGDVRVTVDHPNYLPMRRDFVLPENHAPDAPPTRAIVELDRGLHLGGTVLLDDRPVGGVVVELRDAAGRSEGFDTRLTATDAEGRFVFGGLPEIPLTLSARHERSGNTWSVRWSALVPSDSNASIVLQLTAEDPPLPGSAGDRAARER